MLIRHQDTIGEDYIPILLIQGFIILGCTISSLQPGTVSHPGPGASTPRTHPRLPPGPSRRRKDLWIGLLINNVRGVKGD
ncbi:unnamed protein product [Caretta caretta]